MCNLLKIGERIKEARKDLGFTQEQLGSAVGVNKSTIQRYETGQIEKLKLPVIESIAKALFVNPDWITLHSNEKKLSFPPNMELYNPVMHRIPILGHIAAGMPIFADEHIEGYTYTDLNGGAEYFALNVKGDSMNAANIPDGSLLIVRRQPEVENGEIAVVRVNNDNATVKRFKQDKNIVMLIPQSYNNEHQVQVYDLKKDKIEIIGKAMKCEVDF